MDYRVLFIDEENSQQEHFVDYFESVYNDVTPMCMLPSATLEEMLEKINDYCPDAVIADFRHKEYQTGVKYNVSYTGIELINAIRKEREGFPCFVITSFEDDAVNDTDDVNLVYIKSILKLGDESAKVPFATRVINQIDKYKVKIANARQELMNLIAKRNNGEANVRDEEYIIELDSFLEKSFGAHDSIPTNLKQLSNLKKLNSLIDKVDALLGKLE